MTDGDDLPNVLLVHSHDLGRYLGCYGADVETPRLDAFAEEAAVFDRHFVTAPQCTPSRSSLMTGRFPHVNGLMGLAHGSWSLHDDERIITHYLRDCGYETHLFGLQHISQDTDTLGYDQIHSEGNLYPGVSPAVHEANRARTVSTVVGNCLEKGDLDEPFFASIGFFELHRVEEDNGRFGFDPDHYDHPSPDEIRPLSYLPNRRGIQHDLAEMHGMVHAVDDGFGAILDALDDAGLAENTLVVFTTEHGIAFPRAKGSCYDAGIEAALLLRYPELTDGGERYDELLSNVDLLPTILDLVGEEPPDRVQGRSFLPLLADDAHYEERDCVYAEMTWHDMYNPVRAIRTDRYKYVRNFWHLPSVYLSTDIFASEAGREVRERYGIPPRPYEELYDLNEAPHEDDNVVFEPRYQDVRLELAERLHGWMEETDDPLLDGPVPPGDVEDVHDWPHFGQ